MFAISSNEDPEVDRATNSDRSVVPGAALFAATTSSIMSCLVSAVIAIYNFLLEIEIIYLTLDGSRPQGPSLPQRFQLSSLSSPLNHFGLSTGGERRGIP